MVYMIYLFYILYTALMFACGHQMTSQSAETLKTQQAPDHIPQEIQTEESLVRRYALRCIKRYLSDSGWKDFRVTVSNRLMWSIGFVKAMVRVEDGLAHPMEVYWNPNSEFLDPTCTVKECEHEICMSTGKITVRNVYGGPVWGNDYCRRSKSDFVTSDYLSVVLDISGKRALLYFFEVQPENIVIEDFTTVQGKKVLHENLQKYKRLVPNQRNGVLVVHDHTKYQSLISAADILVGEGISDITLIPRTIDYPGVDLQIARCVGADLSGLQLVGANLPEVIIGNVKLDNANFSNANLQGAWLAGASLKQANFRGTILENADLSKTDLSGADLSNADLTDAKLNGSILTGTNLDNTILKGAVFDGNTVLPEQHYLDQQLHLKRN